VQGEEFSMVLVLPNEKHGLDKLVCHMKPQHLSNMLGTRGTKQVSLALPRFKLTTQMSLVPTLKEVRKELAPQISRIPSTINVNDLTSQPAYEDLTNFVEKMDFFCLG
jgi:hypothetical protein